MVKQSIYKRIRDTLTGKLRKIKRDRNRAFSFLQKFKLLAQSKRRCVGVYGVECPKKGVKLRNGEFHFDHIIPWSLGGPTKVKNGRVLCVSCHKHITNDKGYKEKVKDECFQFDKEVDRLYNEHIVQEHDPKHFM